MKLFVDDIRNAPDKTWHVARTVTEAIRAIARYDFEIISLDHDISHYENLDWNDTDQNTLECKETFAAVAYYIAEKYNQKILRDIVKKIPPKIILHTANSVGGDEMYALLCEHGIPVDKKYTI